MLVGSKDEI
jgi:hypothetical protein